MEDATVGAATHVGHVMETLRARIAARALSAGARVPSIRAITCSSAFSC